MVGWISIQPPMFFLAKDQKGYFQSAGEKKKVAWPNLQVPSLRYFSPVPELMEKVRLEHSLFQTYRAEEAVQNPLLLLQNPTVTEYGLAGLSPASLGAYTTFSLRRPHS